MVRLSEGSRPGTGKTAHRGHDAGPRHAPGAQHAQSRVEETIMRDNTVGLVVTLVLLIVWAPLTAHAQQPAKVPRIGYLLADLRSPCRSDLFVQAFRELGYVEGHNVVIEWRCADGTPERARALAVELVQLPVDVFVAGPP